MTGVWLGQRRPRESSSARLAPMQHRIRPPRQPPPAGSPSRIPLAGLRAVRAIHGEQAFAAGACRLQLGRAHAGVAAARRCRARAAGGCRQLARLRSDGRPCRPSQQQPTETRRRPPRPDQRPDLSRPTYAVRCLSSSPERSTVTGFRLGRPRQALAVAAARSAFLPSELLRRTTSTITLRPPRNRCPSPYPPAAGQPRPLPSCSSCSRSSRPTPSPSPRPPTSPLAAAPPLPLPPALRTSAASPATSTSMSDERRRAQEVSSSGSSARWASAARPGGPALRLSSATRRTGARRPVRPAPCPSSLPLPPFSQLPSTLSLPLQTITEALTLVSVLRCSVVRAQHSRRPAGLDVHRPGVARAVDLHAVLRASCPSPAPSSRVSLRL